MSRRSSVVEPDPKGSSLSRSSSAASHLSRWSKTTPPPSRRGSLDSPSSSDPNHPEELGSFKGHLGHLTPEQEAKLDAFKAELERKGIYQRDGSQNDLKGMGKGHIDDSTLLRFLRARKFDVPGALKQYTGYLSWREEHNVDAEFENMDVEQFEELRRVYPMWTGRRDLRGVPIYVYKISHLTPATLSRLIPNDEASVSTIACITIGMLKFLFPFLNSNGMPTENPETPVSGTNSIIDVSGVGLSRFWGLRSHLQVASQVASANFPETIDRIFVYGAPSFFPTVFNWAKKWFDKGTVDKIFILDSEPLPTLLSMMPSSSIPKEYGGTLEWTFGDDPNLDPAAATCFGAEGYVRGPLVWDSDINAIRKVGTINGKRRDGAVVEKSGSSSTQTERNGEGEEGRGRRQPERKSSAMSSEIPNGASARDAHHLPNGTSPDSVPTPALSEKVIPGTHSPSHHASSLPPARQTESPPPIDKDLAREREQELEDERKDLGRLGHGEEGEHLPDSLKDKTQQNEAVDKGWVPGSGVTEEEFLKGIAGLKV